jgi:hypothetical protein
LGLVAQSFLKGEQRDKAFGPVGLKEAVVDAGVELLDHRLVRISRR